MRVPHLRTLLWVVVILVVVVLVLIFVGVIGGHG